MPGVDGHYVALVGIKRAKVYGEISLKNPPMHPEMGVWKVGQVARHWRKLDNRKH